MIFIMDYVEKNTLNKIFFILTLQLIIDAT